MKTIIASTIRKFILENFLFSDSEESLKNNESFLENGILDSTGILELVAYIEEHFGIEVGDEEMVPTNLDSVDNLVAFISRKKELVRV